MFAFLGYEWEMQDTMQQSIVLQIIRGVVTALVFGMVFFALDNKFGQLTGIGILVNWIGTFLLYMCFFSESYMLHDCRVDYTNFFRFKY